MSSSASESTSFCASSSAPSSAEACLLCIVFSCKDTVHVALYCVTCAMVVYFACLARFLMNFSWELQVIHLPSSDVLAAWQCAGKTFHLAMTDPVLISLPGCVRPCCMMLMPQCAWLPVDADNGHFPTNGLENSSFATAKRTTLRMNFLCYCHHSSSACSVTWTWMNRSSKLKTHYESRVTSEDYTTAA